MCDISRRDYSSSHLCRHPSSPGFVGYFFRFFKCCGVALIRHLGETSFFFRVFLFPCEYAWYDCGRGGRCSHATVSAFSVKMAFTGIVCISMGHLVVSCSDMSDSKRYLSFLRLS